MTRSFIIKQLHYHDHLCHLTKQLSTSSSSLHPACSEFQSFVLKC